MIEVFKIYFKHPSIIVYYIVDALLLGYLLWSGAFFHHWYLISLILVSPFYEWVIHKYILHGRINPSFKPLADYWEKVHPGHHKDPANIDLIFAPTLIGLSVPFQFFLLFVLTGQGLDKALMATFVCMSYYMFYEWNHLAHHLDFYEPVTARGKLLKKAHKWHHFKNEHFWWGITSLWGDKALGTYMDPKEVPMSTTVKNILNKVEV